MTRVDEMMESVAKLGNDMLVAQARAALEIDGHDPTPEFCKAAFLGIAHLHDLKMLVCVVMFSDPIHKYQFQGKLQLDLHFHCIMYHDLFVVIYVQHVLLKEYHLCLNQLGRTIQHLLYR